MILLLLDPNQRSISVYAKKPVIIHRLINIHSFNVYNFQHKAMAMEGSGGYAEGEKEKFNPSILHRHSFIPGCSFNQIQSNHK